MGPQVPHIHGVTETCINFKEQFEVQDEDNEIHKQGEHKEKKENFFLSLVTASTYKKYKDIGPDKYGRERPLIVFYVQS